MYKYSWKTNPGLPKTVKDPKFAYSRHNVPVAITRKQLIDGLSERFTPKTSDSSSDNVTLVDTFEWGLYSNGLIGFRLPGKELLLCGGDDPFDTDLASRIETDKPKARFWWEFKASPERDQLENRLGLRALLPLSDGVLKNENAALEDEQGKSLVFFQITSFYRSPSARKPLFRQIKLTPVTGYIEEYQQAAELLRELGCFEPTLPPIASFLGAIGIKPEPYTVKPELSITPSMPSRAAANAIISQMIEKQRLTEHGVINDIDTEFMHHFRVALRMTRAALAQLKEVYPEQDVVSLKERFGKLGRETNHLRDLDVFILDKQRYLGLLPDSLASGLLPMFDDFEKERTLEVKRVAKWLRSAVYKKEIRELQALFEKGYPACETEWSEKPSIELAVNKIMKRYKKIRKAALTITPDTPDDDIHSLRIECKKLRYLLYFFGGLFAGKQPKRAGKQLKRLQDSLGIFNDLSVQQHYLETYLDEIEHKAKKDIYLIAALGGLISTLHRMQIASREKSIHELHIFSSSANRQLFNQAFALTKAVK